MRKPPPRDISAEAREAEQACSDWMPADMWAQQYGLPDLVRKVQAAWIHGYMAALEARRTDSSGASHE